jgi:hypothetical protein
VEIESSTWTLSGLITKTLLPELAKKRERVGSHTMSFTTLGKNSTWARVGVAIENPARAMRNERMVRDSGKKRGWRLITTLDPFTDAAHASPKRA